MAKVMMYIGRTSNDDIEISVKDDWMDVIDTGYIQFKNEPIFADVCDGKKLLKHLGLKLKKGEVAVLKIEAKPLRIVRKRIK